MFNIEKSLPLYTFTCAYLGRVIHSEPNVDMPRIAAYLSDLNALLHPGDEFLVTISLSCEIIDGFIIGG